MPEVPEVGGVTGVAGADVAQDDSGTSVAHGPSGKAGRLKSFDFVVYNVGGKNLLVDVKGRKVSRKRRGTKASDDAKGAGKSAGTSGGTRGGRGGGSGGSGRGGGVRAMQNWVTRSDVTSLTVWRDLFGSEFDAAFVFMFWCEDEPTDLLYQELFEHGGRWYTLWVVRLDDYTACMRQRSAKWDTLCVPGRDFERMAQPLGEVIRV